MKMYPSHIVNERKKSILLCQKKLSNNSNREWLMHPIRTALNNKVPQVQEGCYLGCGYLLDLKRCLVYIIKQKSQFTNKRWCVISYLLTEWYVKRPQQNCYQYLTLGTWVTGILHIFLDIWSFFLSLHVH